MVAPARVGLGVRCIQRRSRVAVVPDGGGVGVPRRRHGGVVFGHYPRAFRPGGGHGDVSALVGHHDGPAGRARQLSRRYLPPRAKRARPPGVGARNDGRGFKLAPSNLQNLPLLEGALSGEH